MWLFRLFFVLAFFIYQCYNYRTLMLVKSPQHYSFEYYFILVIAMLGLNLMTIASNLLALLLFMEIYSVATYFLLNDKRVTSRGPEASFKYFVLSSLGTAVFLLGLFFLYYATGSLDFHATQIRNIRGMYETFAYFLICLTFFVKLGAGMFYF